MSNATKFAVFAATMGWQAGFESTADGVHIQEADMSKLETELAAGAKAKTDLATANASLEAATAKVGTLEAAAQQSAATIATQATTITNLEAKVADLGKQSSGKGTVIKTATDANGGEENKQERKFAGDDYADKHLGNKSTEKPITAYK